MDIANILILISFGLGMGLLGGLLGIGGAMVLIPMLTFYKGENQHLYQAAAMICIFFVSTSALIAHKKAKSVSKPMLTRMIPGALAGIVAGVALSNSSLFQGDKDYLLARLFGVFLVYVVIYNGIRMYRSSRSAQPVIEELPTEQQPSNTVLTCLLGAFTGMASGLLGIGAGTVATPLQQLFLKAPLKRAMSNSAMLIVSISWLGAIYKNATLGQHRIDFTGSLKIAVCVIPGTIIGGFFGGHLMHALPKTIVRGVFIVVCIVALMGSNNQLVDPAPLPRELVVAANEVADTLNLPEDWLNNGPSSGDGGLFRLGLPDGFKKRLVKKYQGEKLTVYFISRLDQIHFKLYAAVDQFGSYHASDLKQLSPSDEELLMAIDWATTHDPSDGFQTAIKLFLQEFGYARLVDKI